MPRDPKDSASEAPTEAEILSGDEDETKSSNKSKATEAPKKHKKSKDASDSDNDEDKKSGKRSKAKKKPSVKDESSENSDEDEVEEERRPRKSRAKPAKKPKAKKRKASTTGEPDDYRAYGKRFGMTIHTCKECQELNKDNEVEELGEDEYGLYIRICHNCLTGNKALQTTYYRYFGKYADQYRK